MRKEPKKLPEKLPEGIVEGDLIAVPYPKYDLEEKEYKKQMEEYRKEAILGSDFELWHCKNIGWVIPTLHIRNASRRRMGSASTDSRTYAIAVRDEKTYTVGLGPHVDLTTVVHVRRSRLKDLQKYIDMKSRGEENAGVIRDRISSRRAQGALARAERSIW